MKILYIRFLMLLGYRPYRYSVVRHSWHGEEPPLYGYKPNIILKRKISEKEVMVNIRRSTAEGARDKAKEIFDYLEDK